jgi:hypothetical protein
VVLSPEEVRAELTAVGREWDGIRTLCRRVRVASVRAAAVGLSPEEVEELMGFQPPAWWRAEQLARTGTEGAGPPAGRGYG